MQRCKPRDDIGHHPGNPAENRLLSQTAEELDRAKIKLREIVGDGGFIPGPDQRSAPRPDRHADPAIRSPRARLTQDPQRRARYRTGIEGRISHLKHGYGLRRARLKAMTE